MVPVPVPSPPVARAFLSCPARTLVCTDRQTPQWLCPCRAAPCSSLVPGRTGVRLCGIRPRHHASGMEVDGRPGSAATKLDSTRGTVYTPVDGLPGGCLPCPDLPCRDEACSKGRFRCGAPPVRSVAASPCSSPCSAREKDREGLNGRTCSGRDCLATSFCLAQ